jgi:hypothetical protein
VTELVLRKSNEEYAVVNIVPSSKRPEKERKKLFEYRHTLRSFDEIPTLIKGAKVAMGLDPHGTEFSVDILRIEVSGPSRPHFIAVDLHGLIHAKNDE